MTAVGEAAHRKNMPELLSPAGDWESLDAALDNGADAVYLGVRQFSARANARNFTVAEVGQAVSKCHRLGVRVYLAMNTLVKNDEMGAYFETLSGAYAMGIDGVIVQHLSFIEVIKASYPGLRVFASTQAGIGNTASAALAKRADRIILPREMALSEVRAVAATGVPVEVFVHGALCYSFSGMCLFSSFIGNRSGNRGCCAQLCRKKYGGSYCLSTKELCLVRRIPELVEAGISGFKIEGRLRSALYVGVATRLYRKAIDSYRAGAFAVPERELAEVEVVFNRQFTEGFMFGAADLVAPEKPMNRGALLGTVADGLIVLERPVSTGDGVGIWGEGEVTGGVIRDLRRDGQPVTAAVAGDRVSLGFRVPEAARVFLTSSSSIKIAPDFKVERAPLATPRRREVEARLPDMTVRKSGGSRLMVKVYSLPEALDAAAVGADAVFYNILAGDFPVAAGWPEGTVRGAYVPRLLTDAELADVVRRLHEKQPAAILTGNLGFLAHRDEFNVPVYVDYDLNAFNDIDIEFFRKLRTTAVLSPELSIKELPGLRSKDAVILCHGDVVLMNTRVPIEDKALVDEKGYSFPVRREANYWQVLNSAPLGLFNDVRKLVVAGFSQFLIDRAGEGKKLVPLYRQMLKAEVPDRRLRKGYTSGHLFRPVV